MRVTRVLLVFTALCLWPLAAAADTSTPIDMAVASISAPPVVGAGEPFQVSPTVGINPDATTGLPPAPYSLHFSTSLPAELRLIDAHWPGNLPALANCVSSCLYEMQSPSDRGYVYDLAASTPGTYTVTTHITSTSNPDPNPANNSASADVKVVPLVLRLASAAAAPRAGRRFVWAGHLVSAISGNDVRATRVSCAVRLGSRSLRAKASSAVGQVTCGFTLPVAARHLKLTVSVKAQLAAATATATRSYVVR